MNGLKRDVAARSVAMAGWVKPYDREVDYLESQLSSSWDFNIKNFIKTGVYPNNSTEFEIDYMLLNDANITWGNEPLSWWSDAVDSNGHGDGYYRFMLSSWDGGYAKVLKGPHFYTSICQKGRREQAFYHDRTITFSTGASNTFQETEAFQATFNDMRLFCGFYSRVSRNPFRGRIFSAKIWNNGSKVRDFIPVVKNIDGTDVGFMYDRCGSISPITGTSLYANEGTGSFTWG